MKTKIRKLIQAFIYGAALQVIAQLLGLPSAIQAALAISYAFVVSFAILGERP